MVSPQSRDGPNDGRRPDSKEIERETKYLSTVTESATTESTIIR